MSKTNALPPAHLAGLLRTLAERMSGMEGLAHHLLAREQPQVIRLHLPQAALDADPALRHATQRAPQEEGGRWCYIRTTFGLQYRAALARLEHRAALGLPDAVQRRRRLILASINVNVGPDPWADLRAP